MFLSAIFSFIVKMKILTVFSHEFYLWDSCYTLEIPPSSPLHPPHHLTIDHFFALCTANHIQKETSNFSLILISYFKYDKKKQKNFTLIPSVILFILEVLFVNIFI